MQRNGGLLKCAGWLFVRAHGASGAGAGQESVKVESRARCCIISIIVIIIIIIIILSRNIPIALTHTPDPTPDQQSSHPPTGKADHNKTTHQKEQLPYPDPLRPPKPTKQRCPAPRPAPDPLALIMQDIPRPYRPGPASAEASCIPSRHVTSRRAIVAAQDPA